LTTLIWGRIIEKTEGFLLSKILENIITFTLQLGGQLKIVICWNLSFKNMLKIHTKKFFFFLIEIVFFIKKNYMKSLLFILLTLSFSFYSFSQTKQDYKDFIKSHSESSPPLPNYEISIAFGDQLFLKDAKKFAGIELTKDEFQNLILISSSVYTDDTKSNLAFEVIRSFDISGVRKVSLIKKTQEQDIIYEIKLYIKSGYLVKEWNSISQKIKEIESISLLINSDENTADNIKKAFIELAKLSGSVDVFDADDLFQNN
jgi:hypothetical protein